MASTQNSFFSPHALLILHEAITAIGSRVVELPTDSSRHCSVAGVSQAVSKVTHLFILGLSILLLLSLLVDDCLELQFDGKNW